MFVNIFIHTYIYICIYIHAYIYTYIDIHKSKTKMRSNIERFSFQREQFKDKQREPLPMGCSLCPRCLFLDQLTFQLAGMVLAWPSQ